MIHIFTTVVNRPDFVEIQDKLFKKFLKDDYVFHVVDDSLDEDISKEFSTICTDNNINYYRKSQNKNKKFDSPIAGARHATETIQWTYDNIIKKDCKEDIVLFCDSDMFLFDDFSAQDYMKDEIIAGALQVRGHVNYIWNGLMLFDMKKITEIDSNLNFSDGVVDGCSTDIGGHLYYWFKKYNVNFKNINQNETNSDNWMPVYPSEYNGVSLVFQNNDDMWVKPEDGFGFELHLQEKFFHYRAGTNWHTQSTWKTKFDPIKRKAEIFNTIINDLLEDNV